jgi:nucleotide-binding universal stress UspA family protein
MIELKEILCPVDFSEFSRRALDHALGVARCYGSTVTALHVVASTPVIVPSPYSFGVETPPPPMVLPHVDRAAVATEVRRLAEAEEVPGVRVETLVVEAPDVYREILAQAERLGSDLIVVGTHGRSGFERLFLGSTAEKVLRKARVPVMTVPPKAPDAMPRGPVPFTRILCAVDFSESSKAALDYAMSLARESQADLTLAHVIETRTLYADFSPPVVVDLPAWNEEARARLRAMVPDAVRAGCSVSEVVREGTSHHEILALAMELGSDLIVLGVSGRGAVDLFFFGSTTHHVIREARCAVLTLRGKS